MPTFPSNNTAQRRKTPTTKTKQKSKHCATGTALAPTNINTTAAKTATTTSTINTSTAVAPTSPNERLQRYSLSDILAGMMRKAKMKKSLSGNGNGSVGCQVGINYNGNDYISTEKTVTNANSNNNNSDASVMLNSTTTTTKLPSSPRTLCNGSITCCRDVNCSLNSNYGQLNEIVDQQHQKLRHMQHSSPTSSSVVVSNKDATLTSTSNPQAFSQRNRSSTVNRCKQENTDMTATDAMALRDRTSDSDINCDAKTQSHSAKAAFQIASNSNLAGLRPREQGFTVHLPLDVCTWLLFALALCTRFYKLAMPRHIVFDEIHYGKYITFYMRNIFFFDQHPPLGKQLIAAVTHIASDYDANYTFPHIGAEYNEKVPIFWLRLFPALCGSALAPIVYKLLLASHLSARFALLGGLIIVFDNALLTQSRFILMESMLLFFTACGLYYLILFQNSRFGSVFWLIFGLAAATFLTFGACVKYAGFLTYGLTVYLSWRYFWDQLCDATLSNLYIILETISRMVIFTVLPITLYVGIFYIHLQTLYRAGPHDNAMTSAFQASLEGGLASITRGQPLRVVHGSQITLRHTHGRTCWLHSHTHVYPVRYPDKRGSSHQQQVTCYSFKDVNNWWIVKRPEREDLVVGEDLDIIRHGDIIQLVHGITSRGLNSHDVAAPMTPECQEVSCYIDYKINMPGELLWRVEILNRDKEGSIWHAIKSEVRLIHHTTGAALRYSGRQLPEWGFNQHEVVADRVVEHKDAVWNVEEHRYTKTQDQRERERQLLNAEMIPTKETKLSFLSKFFELQTKMFFYTKQMDDHMYSSTPFEWPFLDKGIAYWVETKTNRQIHLLGNIIIWYSGTFGLLFYIILNIFYILRRRRNHFDLPNDEWKRFRNAGDFFLMGYFIHYIPYFTVDRTLFLHHYLPAYLFKILLLCYVFEHFDYLLRLYCDFGVKAKGVWIVRIYRLSLLFWFILVLCIFIKFLPITYGFRNMSTKELINLRWKDTWDFILPREDILKYLF